MAKWIGLHGYNHVPRLGTPSPRSSGLDLLCVRKVFPVQISRLLLEQPHDDVMAWYVIWLFWKCEASGLGAERNISGCWKPSSVGVPCRPACGCSNPGMDDGPTV